MNRRLLVRLVLAAAVCGGAGVTWAQHALEIIPLRHRTVEQVVPVLQPLLEPGGTLTGSRGQLILRASPANVAEIRRALEAIDRPSRRLQILVRLDDAQERSRRALGASGTIGSGGSHVDITAIDSRRSATERVDQRVQVMEGGRAMIFTGTSNNYRETVSGFEVVPRLAGGHVTLDIYQSRGNQAASTSTTARLGEWTELGGISSARSTDERGIASASRAVQSGGRRVWVKVEALD
jgi:hypothetical protein